MFVYRFSRDFLIFSISPNLKPFISLTLECNQSKIQRKIKKSLISQKYIRNEVTS
jgi:hypothetical protein